MKKVLINVEERELRVAILEDEQLVELYIESLDEKSILNNIYKGRVEDVLPGLKAAFVNIGLDRNAFLHFDDVRPDLLWGKYRELNPDMADEVPSAREALAVTAEVEAEGEAESEQEEGKRKRRRGRRGGKKRRPDAEDTYSPGLPVGVTEDDLEDDDEDEVIEAPARVAAPAWVAAPAAPVAAAVTYDEPPAEEVAAEAPVAAERPVHEHRQHGEQTPEEIEARRLARMEKQKQRRERWEQKKLERQQRRQQERAERAERGGGMPDGNVQPQPMAAAAAAPAEHRYVEPAAPAVYGTRAAASAYDTFSSYSTPNRRQLQQNKARYGDNFGNIAVGGTRRHDPRDSQVDFFGPAMPTHEEEHSIWDERQPNLGPVPGIGKAFLAEFDNRGNDRRDRRPVGGQQQNRNNNKKQFTSSNKRRGGKKRSMRKRDNRSYFAFSADDIDNDLPLNNEAGAEEAEKPKKTTRRKAAATADGEEAPKKKPAAKKATAAKKPAAPKKAATKTTTKTAAAKAKEAAPELPLDITAEPEEQKEAPKKATGARKAPATRTRKTAAKAEPAEELKLETTPEAPLAPSEEPAVAAQEKPRDEPAPVAAEETSLPVAAKPAIEDKAAAEVQATLEAAAPPSESAEAPASAATTAAGPGSTAPEGQSQEQPQRRRNSRPTRAERAARHRAKRAEARAAEGTPGQQQTGSGDNGVTAAPETAEAAPVATVVDVPAQVPAVVPQDRQYDRGQDRPRQQQGQGQLTQQQRRDQRRKLRRPQFQEVFKKGDQIMVQVVKEEIGMKGARISSYVSLPGRYLVLLPYPNQEGGISRKVEDIRERKRLKNLLRDISSDETAFIVRTAGVYQEEKEIRDDVEFLSHEWGTIAERYAKSEPTTLVYDDHDILYRLARDVFDDSVTEIYIDSHTEHDKLKQILGKLIPGLVDKVKLYSGAENIFHKFGVTKQIQKAARRKVWLKSGGYLIIDEAEALTAIDVNTGKSVGKDDQEKLILRTNLEAARACARELKLRDIGGLIVIDFIDMKDARNKEQVLSELKLQLRKDRSKTSVSAISEFGLVEMTRKRVRRSLRKTLFMDCPYCQGAGVVLNEQQIWLHIKHEVVRQLESLKPAPSLSITVNPRIRAYIDQNYKEVIRRLEQKYDTEIRVTMSDIYHIENYQIEAAETSGVISGSATMPTH